MPTTWDDLQFGHYVDLIGANEDVITFVSIFTGIEYDTIKSAKVQGVELLADVWGFLKEQPEFDKLPGHCGKYKLPLNGKGVYNIQYESLGQFEDMRQIIKTVKQEETINFTKAFGKYVAVYLQKIRDGEYNPQQVPSMEDEVLKMPAMEVVAVGSFFYLSTLNLLHGTKKTSPNTSRRLNKWRQEWKPFKRNLGNTPPSTE